MTDRQAAHSTAAGAQSTADSHTTRRRSFLILLVLTVMFVLLVGRLAWIQSGLATNTDLTREAVGQRQQAFTADSGRGPILDRHGRPLTGQERRALVLFPLAKHQPGFAEGIKRASAIIGIPAETLTAQVLSLRTPAIARDGEGRLAYLSKRQADAINQIRLPGLAALPVTERYPDDGLARHLIGFLHQNPKLLQTLYPREWASGRLEPDRPVGAAGLERTFDRFLQAATTRRFFYHLDGQGRLFGGEYLHMANEEQPYAPVSLVTSLDAELQRKLESLADEAGLREGSIVVLDVATGDALAVVSRPQFDPREVDVASGHWHNHAVRQIAPGSVFKTVVTAAVLAEGLASPTETFRCEGEYGKYGFSCWKKEGHGFVTLEEAFAQSCNVAFARLAMRVGPERLQEYAERLGLLTPVGWREAGERGTVFHQWDQEEAGALFAPGVPASDEGVLIQTAVGQRDVRMTPLQAAQMMAAIARGGEPVMVRAAMELRYPNGITYRRFDPQPLPAPGIDRATARKLSLLLRRVVTDGTGQALLGSSVDAAGKSGTAQVQKDGEPRVHQWFAGFAPVKHPRFAVAVVAENRPVNAPHLATQLFGRAVDVLLPYR